MFSKLALNNVKRSFKNYSIYFLTLTLAICVFYSFNSLEDQNVMLGMNQNEDFILNMSYFTIGMSIFVSFVLGWLIIYANNFLIKKRKKELGIYISLGMSKGKISRILILETLVIGFLSLVAGILLGIIVSQGMAVVTANILSAELQDFKFVVSIGAIGKTAAYFGIIYALVMLFNQVTISKYKLIDLLHAAKKNEEVKVKNPFVSVLLFLMAVALLLVSYSIFLTHGLAADRVQLSVVALFGGLGTLLYFFSLSNFFIQILQKNKRFYLKDINLFVLRQINNKVNTNFLSMAVISLLLFLTVTFLFIAFNVKGIIDQNAEERSPFDVSGYIYADGDIASPEMADIAGYLEAIDFEFDESERYAFYSEYKLDASPEELFTGYLSEEEKMDLEEGFMFNSIVKLSDYNSIRELAGQKPIDLREDELFIISDSGHVEGALAEYHQGEEPFILNGVAYSIQNRSPVKENIAIPRTGDFLYFVVPDHAVENMQLESTGFNVIYDEADPEESEEKFSALFVDFEEEKYSDFLPLSVSGQTWKQHLDRKNAPAAIAVFLGLFLGLIFIITSAAVLALQQLSDASDSLERYKSLKKIGVTEKLINSAIWKQTFIYFLLPLSLAVIHTAVGIYAIRELLNINFQTILTGTLLVAVIYGGYFYATYLGVKNIVRNSN